jgi:dihydroxyacetone kinase-like protein
MKRILNNPENFVTDMLDGLLKAHPEHLTFTGGDVHCIVRADAPVSGKVGIASGGGSGHLPLFIGYVGKGMLDGCAVGDVFASPNAEQMLEVTRKINSTKGVLYIYGNYGGDVMNFDMAAELAEMEGITVKTILVADDVASAPVSNANQRRGIAGMVLAFKIAGAKAAKGGSLDDVVSVTERALKNLRTVGVALSPCTVPRIGKPTFSIGDDEMEIGMGLHGERGISREKLQSADVVTARMVNTILDELKPASGDTLAVMINGLGATPCEELYIVYSKVNDILTNNSLKIHRAYIGEFATSMEMSGFSITLFKLDDELKMLLDEPSYTPLLKQF